MDACALNFLLSDSQRERFYAQIAQRNSVRLFLDAPDVAQLSALSFAAARLVGPGVRFEILYAEDKKLYRAVPFVDAIMGSGCYAAVIIDTREKYAGIYAGACGEALILEAVSLGVGTCWVTGTYKKSAVQVPLGEGEQLAAIIALGIPAREKHKLKQRKSLQDICVGDPTAWPLWAYEAAEAVRMAPSAINRQPWRLSFSGHTMQLMRKGGGDLDMGIALIHMMLGVKKRSFVMRMENEKNVVATLYSEAEHDAV